MGLQPYNIQPQPGLLHAPSGAHPRTDRDDQLFIRDGFAIRSAQLLLADINVRHVDPRTELDVCQYNTGEEMSASTFNPTASSSGNSIILQARAGKQARACLAVSTSAHERDCANECHGV